MEKFTSLTSRLAPLPLDNIDTDQILPARFLKITSKTGLGDLLFHDWRYHEDGSPNADFILNRPESQGSHILLAGNHFGCGSSREHAPWALVQYGFRAVISTSFGDIFTGNALKNSLLPVVIGAEEHKRLLDAASADPATTVSIDLESQTAHLPDGVTVTFPIDEFAKHCMLEGVDELGFILQQEDAISQFEARRPLSVDTRATA